MKTLASDPCRIFGVLLSVSLLLAAGCASQRGFPDRSASLSCKTAHTAECELKAVIEAYFEPHTDVFKTYASKETDLEKRSYRDEVAYSRMRAYDLQFALFQEAIYKEAVGSNLWLDIAGVVVGGAGAAVTSTDGSRILSALSGGLSGARTSINKNLYYERTMPALMATMVADREQVKAEIIQYLDLPVTAYPLARAMVDLERYFNAGSIPGAVANISKEAGKSAQQAVMILEEERTKKTVTAEAQERIERLIDAVDGLLTGQAADLLVNPPLPLGPDIVGMVEARLDNQPLTAATLSNRDLDARALLKMVLVLLSDRSEEALAPWLAAIEGLSETEPGDAE